MWIAQMTADLAIAKAAARNTSPLIQNCARAATWAADAHVLGPIVAAAWLFSRRGHARQRARANHLALTLTAAVVLPHLVKHVVDRERPDRSVVGPDRKGVRTSGNPRDSFPSGHAVHIGAMASAMAWAYPRKAPLFWIAGGVVAATRVGVLAHWASDVVVGLASGIALERAVRRLTIRSSSSSDHAGSPGEIGSPGGD
jgi:membrane-associated phospholipid phosphatase